MLCIEPYNVLDVLEHLLPAEVELALPDEPALSLQSLLLVRLLSLLVQVMQQINQHLQHNLRDDQRVNSVDDAEYILVLQFHTWDLQV